MRAFLFNATQRRLVDATRICPSKLHTSGKHVLGLHVRAESSNASPGSEGAGRIERHEQEERQERKERQEQDHDRFMDQAIEQAKLAYSSGEVPVGAVLVNPDGKVVSRGFNKTETEGDPTSHAEMNCIRQASGMRGGWRLLDCTLYVTLEPCPMCAGAILQSRVGAVVYGARNALLGADGSWIQMFDRQRAHPFHPRIHVVSGVREEECARLMKNFFRERRTFDGRG
jgi:tRNA(adenine34) deaminase